MPAFSGPFSGLVHEDRRPEQPPGLAKYDDEIAALEPPVRTEIIIEIGKSHRPVAENLVSR